MLSWGTAGYAKAFRLHQYLSVTSREYERTAVTIRTLKPSRGISPEMKKRVNKERARMGRDGRRIAFARPRILQDRRIRYVPLLNKLRGP
jgi:hypothetical protein